MSIPAPFGTASPAVAAGRAKGSVPARLRSARAAAGLGLVLLLAALALMDPMPLREGSPGSSDPVAARAGAIFALMLVPLAVGVWVATQRLAITTAGSHYDPLPLRVLFSHPRGPFEPPAPGAGPALQAAARLWGWGLRAMGAAAWAALLAAARFPLAGTRARDVVHADPAPERLVEHFRAIGLAVERRGGTLLLQPLGGAEGVPVAAETVRLRTVPLTAVPGLPSARLLVMEGPARGVRRVRKVLESDLLFDARFTWSAPARRVEGRLNGLHRDAARASTTEEIATLLEDVKGLQAVLARRDLVVDEAHVLGEKAHRVRAALEGRLLSGPLGVKGPHRAIAPAPVLLPRVEHLLEARGAALTGEGDALTYYPFYVVPFQARPGGGEVLLDALTREAVPEERGPLLEAASEGCTRILESGRGAHFMPAGPVTPAVLDATEAHLRERARVRGPLAVDATTVEVLYVPYVSPASGGAPPRSAVTGGPLPTGAPPREPGN